MALCHWRSLCAPKQDACAPEADQNSSIDKAVVGTRLELCLAHLLSLASHTMAESGQRRAREPDTGSAVVSDRVMNDFMESVWDRFHQLENSREEEGESLKAQIRQLEWALVRFAACSFSAES